MPISSKTTKQRVQAGDFASLKIPRMLSLSPDGAMLAHSLARCELDKNAYASNLYVMDTRSGESRQWTFGNWTDRSPVWSGDGKRIAFLRFENGQDGIYVLSLKGGEPHRIFAAKGFFGDIRWANDDKTIIGMFLKADENPAQKSVPVRKITRLFSMMEDMGFLPQERRQLYKLDLKTLKFSALTKGRADVGAWAMAPDGVTVGYVTNTHRDPDTHSMNTEIHLLNILSGKKTVLPLPFGEKNSMAFSPNGKYLVYLGHNNPQDAWSVERVHPYLVNLNMGKLRDLTPYYDRMAGDFTLGDTGFGGGGTQVLWSADSRHVYYQVSDEGDTTLVRAGLKAGDPEKVWSRHGVVTAVAGNGKQLALSHASFDVFGDIYICDDMKSADTEFRKLAVCNKE